MKDLNIDLLSESESGQLRGGFVVMDGEEVSETSIINGNCGTESGVLVNSNCGCHACRPSTPPPAKPHGK